MWLNTLFDNESYVWVIITIVRVIVILIVKQIRLQIITEQHIALLEQEISSNKVTKT